MISITGSRYQRLGRMTSFGANYGQMMNSKPFANEGIPHFDNPKPDPAPIAVSLYVIAMISPLTTLIAHKGEAEKAVG